MNQRNTPLVPFFISKTNLLRISVAIAFVALVAFPLLTVSSASLSQKFSHDKPSNAPTTAKQQMPSILNPSAREGIGRFMNFLAPAAESISTYAADCTTPKTLFFLGEVVCAKTSGVTEPDRLVNWLQPPDSSVVFGGNITADPQDFLFTPTVTGEWKASIASSTDSSILPAFFTVNPPPMIATYAGDCGTPNSSFSLGETLCVKLNNAPIGSERVVRRIELVDPEGFIVDRRDVVNGNQTETFTLPTDATYTTTFGWFIDNRGTWRANLTDTSDASVRDVAFVTLHDPNLQVADLQISKAIVDNSQVNAGANVQSVIWLFNAGPDTAVNPRFSDVTPSNTTFQTITQTLGPAFNCTTPGTGNPGTTTCTGASLVKGGVAAFTITYTVSGSVGNGASLDSTATATSDTFERSSVDNSSDASITSVNPTNSNCTLTCPDNVTATADTVEDVEGIPTSGAHVTFAAESAGDCGTLSASTPSGSFFPVGSTPVTIASADGGSCSFVVTVVSSGSPVTISCPASITTQAGAGCQAAVTLGTPTTTGDNVTVVGTRSDGRPLTDPFTAGTTTVTWTATNTSGAESCTQTVTVNDITPPVIVAPATSSASADANCQAAIPDVAATSTVSDNCACASADESESCDNQHDISIIQTPAAGTLVGLGTHQITLTADDGAGNVATATVSFTVNDTTQPAFTFVPANVSASTGPGAASCDVVLDPGTATATDSCGPVTVTRSPAGNTFPVGSTTITWTATDGANNTTTATQTVTVIDNTPPTISCPSNITTYLPLNSSATSMTVNYVAPVGTDNCAGTTTTQTGGLASGATFPVGTTTNTFRATDAAGNYTECSFTITVLYNFTGFFSPVNNLPTLNSVNAGRAIPVKFSLSGNKGLNIFAADSPSTVSMTCDTLNPGVDIIETLTAGGSSLSFGGDQYHYVWKTENSWAGTCRQLIIRLNDGSIHTANFKFK